MRRWTRAPDWRGLLVLGLLLTFLPRGWALTTSGVLQQDETWSGHVRLTGDVVIPPGRSLTLLPGTRVSLTPQQSDYDVAVRRQAQGRERELAHRGLIDLVVQGRLRAEGGRWWWQRIELGRAGEDLIGWGGVVFVGEPGASTLSYVTVHHAQTAIRCLDRSSPVVRNSLLKLNVNGLEAYHDAAPEIHDSRLRANFRGLGVFDRAVPMVVESEVRVNNQGIWIEGQAMPVLRQLTVSKNTTGILVRGQARPQIDDSLIGKKWLGWLYRGNRRGVVLADRAAPRLRRTRIWGNETGLVLRDQAQPELDATEVSGNQTDVLDRRLKTP